MPKVASYLKALDYRRGSLKNAPDFRSGIVLEDARKEPFANIHEELSMIMSSRIISL